MMDIERVRGALNLIGIAIDGNRNDAIAWNLGWRDAVERINVFEVMRSCKRLLFDGDDRDKREAKIVARILKRAHAFARQIEEVERDAANLYPAERARHRLDHELGWEHMPDDDTATRLDRSCMIARTRHPDAAKLRRNAHGVIRSRFAELEAKSDV